MRQKGITLVELMIALVLGLIIVAGVIQIYVSNKQAYRVTDAQSQLQDSARFALDTLTRDIRSAGFTGCRSVNNIDVISIAKATIPPNVGVGANLIAAMAPDIILSGHEATGANVWSPALPAAINGTVISGTDVISIQSGRSCDGNLVANTLNTDGPIQIVLPNSCGVSPDSLLMISDCTHAHIFRAESVSNSGNIQTISFSDGDGNASNDNNQATHLCKNYPSLPHAGACNDSADDKTYDFDSELFLFNNVTYFIRQGENGNPALWLFNNNAGVSGNNPIEIAANIENMQIEYGVGGGVYERANTLSTVDRENLVSAKIHLLAVTSDQNLTTSAQSLEFNGANINLGDGRLGRVFTTMVGVRNRMQ